MGHRWAFTPRRTDQNTPGGSPQGVRDHHVVSHPRRERCHERPMPCLVRSTERTVGSPIMPTFVLCRPRVSAPGDFPAQSDFRCRRHRHNPGYSRHLAFCPARRSRSAPMYAVPCKQKDFRLRLKPAYLSRVALTACANAGLCRPLQRNLQFQSGFRTPHRHNPDVGIIRRNARFAPRNFLEKIKSPMCPGRTPTNLARSRSWLPDGR
jgi:hypothetical protein